MKTKFLLFFFLFTKIILAQEANDKIIYLDSLERTTSQENEVFHRIIKDYYTVKKEYSIIQFYKSGSKESEGVSLDRDYLKPHGEVVHYYENGAIKSKCNYDNSSALGNYSSWYENGAKKVEGVFVQKQKDSNEETVLKIDQYWESNGVKKVIDGNGIYEDVNNTTESTGLIKNGFKEGTWKGKSKIYNFNFNEEYKNGDLILGKSVDKENLEHSYTKIFLKPEPKKGLQHFYKYIAKKFRIPKNAENVSGKIILRFVINTDGSIANVKIEKGLGYGLDEEAIRLISEYPDWGIGEFRGVKVKTSYAIPIVIQPSE
ncbi:energy transducer TonB [Flavobacterium sp. SUN052]|uniref:energy transducer TonB n=1 Tax=Flavobacterium sp. SUN052 TaxID=3002441 RepID=UPI00237E22AB|nr:energy transducer TonB [Flavobacterium sp. SUN052]MEC4004654.1 energy transducer TonB [Flavobacterium sp. SUN052]